MENKELLSKVAELFSQTNYDVLWAIQEGDMWEFFTTENFAQNACKNGETPLKFTRKECLKTEVKQSLNTVKTVATDSKKGKIRFKAGDELDRLPKPKTNN